jgi:hypothetical protein
LRSFEGIFVLDLFGLLVEMALVGEHRVDVRGEA